MRTESTPVQAFDPLAKLYDDDFTQSQIGTWLRNRVHDRLRSHWQAGDSILELGCGTGEDALRLSQHGLHVTATDVSEGMLEVARQKTQGNPNISVMNLDLRNLRETILQQTFDGAFSNFGPLNCLGDWQPLAAWLAQRIKPGGIVGLGIMAQYCLWEMGWHGLHLHFKTAFRRLRRSNTFQLDETSEAIPIHYPSIRRITTDFAPYFQRVHVQPLGLFLPPSDVYGVIEKHPRLLKWLLILESCFGNISFLASFADHYWIEFQRVR